MQIQVFIRPQSAIHKLWRNQHLRVGFLHNTRFVWNVRAQRYFAEEPIRNVEDLKTHPDAEVEIFSEPKPAKVETEQEPAETKTEQEKEEPKVKPASKKTSVKKKKPSKKGT